MSEFILYDCDTGSDDAVALMMLLSQHERVTPVAITCVGGNTPVDQVALNNLRVLKLFDMLGKVPVFRGSAEPMVPIHKPTCASHVHGSDGMGGNPDLYPAASSDLLEYLETEHAVQAIIRLSKKHEGKLKVVATGPLTNLALAAKLDPELPKRLSDVYVMGGTRSAKGNVTAAAEFNFHFDPESVWITMDKYPPFCTVHLIDYEYTTQHPTPWDWFDSWLVDKKNCKHDFVKMMLQPLVDFTRDDKNFGDGLVICDAYAMAMAIDKNMSSKARDVRLVVELSGFYARGFVAVDEFNRHHNSLGPVRIYDHFNLDDYHQLLHHVLQ